MRDLFRPLGMTSCGFGAQGRLPNQPWGHKIEGTVAKPIPPNFNADNPPTVSPSGTNNEIQGVNTNKLYYRNRPPFVKRLGEIRKISHGRLQWKTELDAQHRFFQNPS